MMDDYLRRWDADRTLYCIHHALYVLCREQAGREPSPAAAIIDSQSVKGKKRYILDNTQGLLIQTIITRPTSRTAMAACC